MAGDVSEQDVRRWGDELERVCEEIAPRFGRPEIRQRAPRYVQGLIAQVDRKNGWQLADYLGDETPKNLQHFIARSQWSADEVRDDLARLRHIRPILFRRPHDFFLNVSFNFFSARRSVPGCSVVPNSTFNSSSVRSGCAAIAARI